MCASQWRPLLQHPRLWGDNLLFSPATCHPTLPRLPPSLSFPSVAFTPRAKGQKNQADPQPVGSTLLMWIKDWETWGFTIIDVCQTIQRPNKCTPHPPITSLKTPPIPAHSFATYQNHFPAAVIWIRGPPLKKRRHLAHALEAKKEES